MKSIIKPVLALVIVVTLLAATATAALATPRADMQPAPLALPDFMVDNFESYTSTSALQAIWTPWGGGAERTLVTTGVNGSKAMQLAASGTGIWYTIAGTLGTTVADWTGYDGLEFWIYNNSASKIDLGVELEENGNVSGSMAFGGKWDGHSFQQNASGAWVAVPNNGTMTVVPAGYKGPVRIPWLQMRQAEWKCANPTHDPTLCNQAIRLASMGKVKIGYNPTQFPTNILIFDNVGAYLGNMEIQPTVMPSPTFVAPAMTKHTLTAATSPADNPLKGFMPYRNPLDDGYYGQPGQTTDLYNQFPHSQEWQYIPLKDLMNGMNSFTWGPLDTVLNDVASRGNTAVFRVYLDYPAKPNGVPDFLKESQYGLVQHVYQWPVGQPFSKNCTANCNYSPDYNNTYLLQAVDNFVAALSARYDGDPRIGFITIGIVGFWAEWHTWPMDGYCNNNPSGCENWMPSAESQSRVIHTWVNNFKKTRILLRQPMADSALLPIGYHDDSFTLLTLPKPYESNGSGWFFWGRIQSAMATEIWKTQAIGGEMRPEVQMQMFTNDPPKYTGVPIDPNLSPDYPNGYTGQDYYNCLNVTHASWLLVQGPFASPLPEPQKSRAVEASRRMGYDFYVPYAFYYDTLSTSESLDVGIELDNRGVAPFYYDWLVQLGAKDSGGNLVATWDTNWKLTTVLPGTKLFQTSIANHGLGGGTHTLVMRVINPLEATIPAAHKLRFGNTAQGADGWLTLGAFQVGGTPRPTSTITSTPTPITPTSTPTITNTPATFTTGWLSPSANAPDAGGHADGFESNPTAAYSDDGSFATDIDSGTGSGTDCAGADKDKHRFYNYTIPMPAGGSVRGIEVRLDARVDQPDSMPKMCVQLSWDGGTTWTAAKSTATLTASEASYTLGGNADAWGRAWTVAETSNANFRLRVINTASSTSRDFYLDWVTIQFTFNTSGGVTSTLTPTGGIPTNTPTATPTRTNTPVGPTNTSTATLTRTNTPVGPTATRTNTPVAPTNTPTPGNVNSYEAEASGNTLAGGAVRASCSTCSGGNKVGYVGNNSGMLQFNGVNATSAGSYALTIYYLSGEARSAQISVNGGAANTLNFASTGGWTTVGTLQTTVSLNAGGNTIKFSGTGWAPDFDRITVNTGGGPTNTPVPPTATRNNTPVSPTATRTNTPMPPTVTRTNTPGSPPPPPTLTRTSTPVVPTATRTNTPVVPTTTRTSTPVVPTATPTNTLVPPTVTPTMGATVMIDSFTDATKWGTNHLNDLNKAVSWAMGSIYYGSANPGEIVMNSSLNGDYYQETITQSLAGKTTLTLRLRDWWDSDTENHWNIVLNDGTDHTVALSAYGNVNANYQDINIPLSAFGANLANAQYLRITHKDSTYAVLLIDMISVK